MGLFNIFKRKENRSQNNIDDLISAVDETLGEDKNVPDEDIPLLYESALHLIFSREQASATLLEAYLNISFQNAMTIINKFEACGIISSSQNRMPRKILVPDYESAILKLRLDSIDGLNRVDSMTGPDFEYWCAELLGKNGFINIVVTPSSGDQGVDITAEKDGVRYAVQCKRYNSNLDNTPVQEVYAGRMVYHCQVGVVMTNQYFTDGAKVLAEKTGVLLWDRDKLIEMLEIAP